MSEPRKIVIGRIPNDFSPATHAILGSWSFYKAEHIYPEWDELLLIDPFASGEVRVVAERATAALANRIFDELWPQMNSRHSTRYSRDYWHAVMMGWLYQLVQLVWKLYRHVTCFIETSKGEAFNIAIADPSSTPRFGSTTDFTDACFQPGPFSDWLLSAIVVRLAPANWRVSKSLVLEWKDPQGKPYVHRRRDAVTHVPGMERWRRVYSAYASLLPRKRQQRVRSEKRIPAGFFPDTFMDLINGIVAKAMPSSMTSGFQALKREAQSYKYYPGRIYAVTPDPESDQDNVIRAAAIEAGERVIAIQHGGAYGWAGPLALQAEIEYGHDAFVTWGWTRQGGYTGRFVPLPSPLLSRNIGRHRQTSRDIVFVGTAMHSLSPRIEILPSVAPYRKWKGRFVEALDYRASSSLRYRPYLWVHGFSDLEWLRKRWPCLKSVDGDFARALFGCRLLVLDHPVTTMAIALAANIPTVMFWEKEAWPLSPEAEPLFDELRAANVIFDSPESAAQCVNAIQDDVVEWWADARRQQTRRNWCDAFACSDKAWRRRWFIGLARL